MNIYSLHGNPRKVIQNDLGKVSRQPPIDQPMGSRWDYAP